MNGSLRRVFAAGAEFLAAAIVSAAIAHAGDWPQILGPDRNGIAQNERIANTWPAAGPKVVWQLKVGSGYAGVAVSGDRLLLWHRVGNESVAMALDPATGQKLWQREFPTSYTSTIAPDDGPRCVPVLASGSAVLVGAGGDVHCLALADGKSRWDRDAFQEFNAPEGYFGAGSTPIVVGDRVVMNVGGKGAGVVAFSLADGKILWQATDNDASYSSPTVTKIGGVPAVIAATRLNTVALDSKTGRVLWQYPFGMRGPTVNAATPLVFGDHLFLSASYGIGARWLKLSADKPDELWESDDVMSSQYATSVAHEGVLYGVDGRQDQGVARLRAFDPATKKIYWTEEGFGPANLILADGKLIAQKINGTLKLIEPTTKKYRELASFKAFPTTAQALPALAGGKLFVRDTQTLKCLDLSP